MINSVARITIAALSITASYLAAAEHRPFAVMPEETAKQINQRLCSREGVAGVEGGWKPSVEIIERIEKELHQIAKLESKGGVIGASIREPESYFRQYVGITIAERHLIYINAFTTPQPNWQDQLVKPCDGGVRNWGVLYSPADGTFFDLRTNGSLAPHYVVLGK
jgi:hypothetical protein